MDGGNLGGYWHFYGKRLLLKISMKLSGEERINEEIKSREKDVHKSY